MIIVTFGAFFAFVRDLTLEIQTGNMGSAAMTKRCSYMVCAFFFC